QFYLLVTPGDKPFRTKDFSHALEVSRVSFATPEKLLDLLGCKVGAATIFGLLLDPGHSIRLVIDKDVLSLTDYACTDTTTTGYMKIKTSDVMDKFLPHIGRTPDIITL
ncbi:MAG: prolyl-tRNA synthetase associated domain-containing protein, partial [Clostridia bacterium]|nr:prolyl-tRNA synthetase associated domain-containing protein [Clostridia bacterium]